MAENIIVALVEQVPALAVLCFLTIKFLHAQKETASEFADKLKTIGAGCHEVQRESVSALSENTAAFGRVEHALDKVERKL